MGWGGSNFEEAQLPVLVFGPESRVANVEKPWERAIPSRGLSGVALVLHRQ